MEIESGGITMRYFSIPFILLFLFSCNQAGDTAPLRIEETEQATYQVWKEATELGYYKTGPIELSLNEVRVIDAEWHISFIVDGLDSAEGSYIYVDYEVFAEEVDEELIFDTDHFTLEVNGEEILEEVDLHISNGIEWQIITESPLEKRMYFPLKTVQAADVKQVTFMVKAPFDANGNPIDKPIRVDDVF